MTMKSFISSVLLVITTSAAIPFPSCNLGSRATLVLIDTSYVPEPLLPASFIVGTQTPAMLDIFGSHFIDAGLSSTINSFENTISTEVIDVTRIVTSTVTGPFRYPPLITRTALFTSTATELDTATTLITAKSPCRYPLPKPSTTFITSIETNRVTVTAPPTTRETASDTVNESMRRNDIIFGVLGTVFAFGAVLVGGLAYKFRRSFIPANEWENTASLRQSISDKIPYWA